jgi:virginiamycin A acetyltransferase
VSTTPGLRAFVARIADVVALVLAVPAASMCWLERRLNAPSEAFFHFWAHCFALAPGVPGNYLRRGFYRLTLDRCSGRFTIAFGVVFAHREAEIQDGVYIGNAAASAAV